MAGRLIGIGLVGLALGCANSPAIDASERFQADYDRALRDDPASFLTTIAAHYLAPDDSLALDSFDPEVSITATASNLTVARGDATESFEAHGQRSIDARHQLSISRQDPDWRILVHDLDAPARAEFTGIAWFPIDPAWIIEAEWRVRTPREPMPLQTSRGTSKTLYVAAEAEFELADATIVLLVFGYQPEPSPDEPLLIPFRDASSGHESYGAGRYLEPMSPAGASLILDFNRATNPYCAYSEHYNCPMPPQFNQIPVKILAGAKSPAH